MTLTHASDFMPAFWTQGHGFISVHTNGNGRKVWVQDQFRTFKTWLPLTRKCKEKGVKGGFDPDYGRGFILQSPRASSGNLPIVLVFFWPKSRYFDIPTHSPFLVLLCTSLGHNPPNPSVACQSSTLQPPANGIVAEIWTLELKKIALGNNSPCPALKREYRRRWSAPSGPACCLSVPHMLWSARFGLADLLLSRMTCKNYHTPANFSNPWPIGWWTSKIAWIEFNTEL